MNQIRSDLRKTEPLHSMLNVAVRERTEISLNTRTDDGTTNGAASVIKMVQVHQIDRQTI